MKQNTVTFRAILAISMILAGSLGTISSNFQNSQYVEQGKLYKAFFHPYLQAAGMFLALTIAGVTYIITKKIYPQSYVQRQQQAAAKGLKLKMNVLYLFIPAFFDLISSTLQYTSLNFVSASIYQMMRGGTVLTTFVFSILFLKLKIKNFQLYGCALVLVGVIVVGINNILFSKKLIQDETQTAKQVIGFLLIGLSWLSNACVLTYQQKLFSQYHLEPLYVVGVQGCFGILIQIVLIGVLSVIPCPFGVDACVFTDSGQPYFERPSVYLQQICSHPYLLLAVIISIMCSFVFNVAGVAITKYMNALARSICDITRTSLVWIIGIFITIVAGPKNPNYRWQLIGSVPIIIQLLGFAILIIGNLTYNSFVKWFCFQKQYQQEEAIQKQIQQEIHQKYLKIHYGSKPESPTYCNNQN